MESVTWTVNDKLWKQFMTVVSLQQSHEKSILGLQKVSERKGIINIKNNSIRNDIHIRRHLHETAQVMCGI